MIIDSISSLHMGLGGKKIKDKNRVAPMLEVKDPKKTKTTKESRRSSAIRAYRRREAEEAKNDVENTED